MRSKLTVALLGVVAAILAQTLIALAETWSFGPSLEPLQHLFGWLTFPIVTAVTLGVLIAAVFFAASRVAEASSPVHTVTLVLPFALLQLMRPSSTSLDFFAVFYPLAYVLAAVLGGVWRHSATHPR